MSLRQRAQAFAPICAGQPRAVEFRVGEPFGDEFDVQQLAVHELLGMGARHFRRPIPTQTLVGNYSHFAVPLSPVTTREKNPGAVSALKAASSRIFFKWRRRKLERPLEYRFVLLYRTAFGI